MAISRESLCGIVGKEGTGEIFDRVLQLVLADGAFIDGKQSKPNGQIPFIIFLTFKMLHQGPWLLKSSDE